jgi:hypothetical protein
MKSFVLASVVASRAFADSTDIYAEAPDTVLGCECTSPCEVGLLFHCNVAPVCKVKDKNCQKGTADYSVSMLSYYDYCEYNKYQSYEALTAGQKKSLVLGHVHGDTSPSTYPSTLSVLTGIMGESVRVSFEGVSDIFPEERKKWIHSVGVTGGIKFESTGDHGYTGLFQGADHGLIRFSSAKETGKGGVAPGMGIKFFRDGRPSANFVAMYSLDGQPCTDQDFFAHPWSNHISLTDNFGLEIIAAKFWQASYCPLMVGLSDLSSESENAVGTFPFQLTFHALVKSDCPCQDYVKCLANLASIAVGTQIFEVRAIAQPGAAAELIGHITLTDELTTSKFGDEELFFKHQHMEDDFELRPAWLAAIDRKQQCGMGCTGTKPPTIEQGCSSPFNNTETSDGMLTTDIEVVV